MGFFFTQQKESLTVIGKSKLLSQDLFYNFGSRYSDLLIVSEFYTYHRYEICCMINRSEYVQCTYIVFQIGGIQQLRGPNFTQFWPPPSSSGHVCTWCNIYSLYTWLSVKFLLTPYLPPTCPRSSWMTPWYNKLGQVGCGVFITDTKLAWCWHKKWMYHKEFFVHSWSKMLHHALMWLYKTQ